MGTFTKLLSEFLTEQALKEADKRKTIVEKEEALKKAVSQLQISQSEKKKLEKQITELRQSSNTPSFGSIISADAVEDLLKSYTGSLRITAGSVNFMRTCAVCGKGYDPLSVGVGGYKGWNRCANCWSR